MIIKASQRSGGAQLAAHLLNMRDNDHVTVLELRGFIAEDLRGAFEEAHAISKATRCTQFLFSVSFNPPEGVVATEQDFIAAAGKAEQKFGLSDQPRAIVIHEKEGRRHAHVVWSRIDAKQLTAINLPFYKQRLNELAKELYLDHGWQLPDGMKSHGGKNPMNFTREEWQQAKRHAMDPREIKAVFREAWEQSDSLKALGNALADKGYFIAKGDRRGFVAVDLKGEVYAIPRWMGIKAKDAKEKLGDPDQLESVADVQRAVAERVAGKLRTFMDEVYQEHPDQLQPLKDQREKMVKAQRQERRDLREQQEARQAEEGSARHARFRKGLMGLVDFVTGRARAIRKENEADLERCTARDSAERQELVEAQMAERKTLQAKIAKMMAVHSSDRTEIAKEVVHYMRIAERKDDRHDQDRNRQRKRDSLPEHGGGRERTR